MPKMQASAAAEVAESVTSGVACNIATPQSEVVEADPTRKWIRRLARRSIQLGAFLLDRFPAADHDGIQVFRPDARALRDTGGDAANLDGSPWTNCRRGLASFDGRLASGEWESGRGRHEIKFDFDEWVYVLDGSAEVTVQGKTTVLKAGDSALFRAGLTMKWNVPRHVRKVWVHRYSQPNLVERGVLAMLRWLTTGPSAPALVQRRAEKL